MCNRCEELYDNPTPLNHDLIKSHVAVLEGFEKEYGGNKYSEVVEKSYTTLLAESINEKSPDVFSQLEQIVEYAKNRVTRNSRLEREKADPEPVDHDEGLLVDEGPRPAPAGQGGAALGTVFTDENGRTYAFAMDTSWDMGSMEITFAGTPTETRNPRNPFDTTPLQTVEIETCDDPECSDCPGPEPDFVIDEQGDVPYPDWGERIDADNNDEGEDPGLASLS